MDERVIQLRIGLMVLATCLITGILMITFGGKRTLFQRTYTIRIEFDEAPGVTRDTPVQKSGVLIGRVSNVELLDQGGVIVTAKIEGNRKIFSDEVCFINRSLLGDSVLEFVKKQEEAPENNQDSADAVDAEANGHTESNSGSNGNGGSNGNAGSNGNGGSDQPGDGRVQIQDGARLKGKVYKDPFRAVDALEKRISEAIGSAGDTSKKATELMEKVNRLMDDNQQSVHDILTDTAAVMKGVRKAVGNYEGLASDAELRDELEKALRDLPKMVGEARQTLDNMNRAIADARLALQDVRGFSQTLKTDGSQIVEHLDNGARDLEAIMQEMRVFSEGLNSRQGTLGKLMHDPELYDRVNRTMGEVEDLTRQLKPVVRDARVFSDKIARHPELLGVRGALSSSPGVKGVPRYHEPP